MKSCDGIKIEAVGDSPTGQLNEQFCQLKYYSRTGCCLGGVSLNRHNHSSTDTSSIALTNYDFQPTSRLTQLPIEDSMLLSTTNNKD